MLQMYYGKLHLKNFKLCDAIFIHINLERELFKDITYVD